MSLKHAGLPETMCNRELTTRNTGTEHGLPKHAPLCTKRLTIISLTRFQV
jgi:hypothetical protein